MLPAELQWGNVAEWVGGIAEWVGAIGTAGALVLGLLILLRDRANAARAQVNLVGAWGEPTYEHKRPGEPRVEMAEIRICVRNGSQLPVVVKRLAFSVHTKWVTQLRSYYAITERGPMACYFLPYFRVPADDTWETRLLVKLPALADGLQFRLRVSTSRSTRFS